jgi:putative dehydrogenase
MIRIAAKSQAAVAVIGLGIMGSAIASHLAKAGVTVHGVDVDISARKRLARVLTSVDASVSDALVCCKIAITSLPSVGALEAVVKQILALGKHCPKGLVVMETSTLPLTDKLQARDQLAAIGVTLLDCPLSGTGAQAKKKDLAIYASGERRAISRIRGLCQHFSRVVYDVGAFGNGTQMKLVANLLVALHNVSTAEALLFGQRLGLDQLQMVNVLSDGAGGSRMLSVRGPVMANRTWQEAAMKVGVWQKDMEIIGDALKEAKVPAPLFSASVPIYLAAMAQGHALHDTAAVYAVLARMAGEDIPQ